MIALRRRTFLSLISVFLVALACAKASSTSPRL